MFVKVHAIVSNETMALITLVIIHRCKILNMKWYTKENRDDTIKRIYYKNSIGDLHLVCAVSPYKYLNIDLKPVRHSV